MSEIGEHEDVEQDGFESIAYQGCYIYRPGHGQSEAEEPPRKKRKVNGTSEAGGHFPKLSDTEGCASLAQRREILFDEFWSSKKLGIELQVYEEAKLSDLLTDLGKDAESSKDSRLKTALLLTGAEEASHASALEEVAAKLEVVQTSVLTRLRVQQCPNLQSALKSLIRATITSHANSDGYVEFINRHKRLLPLAFDLELLEKYVSQHNLKQVLVAISDVETFDGHVLNEFINVLHLWRARIPFALILGVTSTRKLFETKLSKSCLAHIQAREYDFSPNANVTSDLVRAAQACSRDEARVFLGPSITSLFSDLAQTQGKTLESSKDVLKYIYMSHMFANELSILAFPAQSPLKPDEERVLAQSVRSTESFRTYCETLLASKDKASLVKLRQMLEDDRHLLSYAQEQVQGGQTAYALAIAALYSLSDLRHALSDGSRSSSRLETEIVLYQSINNLVDTDIYDEVESIITGIPTSRLFKVLESFEGSAIETLDLSDDLIRLRHTVESGEPGGIEGSNDSRPPQQTSTPNKKRKSGKATKAEAEKPGKDVVATMVRKLRETLSSKSYDISSQFLHEAYILTNRTLQLKPLFEPQPRAVMERALLQPSDYLSWNHDLGESNEGEFDYDRLKPGASTLFTLLQEAPTIINVRDLFDAFIARTDWRAKPDGIGNGDETIQSSIMSSFYQALAELKMLGLVKSSTGTQIKRGTKGKTSKSSKQDIDFVSKTSWASL